MQQTMNKLQRQIKHFVQLESAGGILLLAAAILAMLVANSPLAENHFNFLQTHFTIKFGDFGIDKPILMWINDGLMAVFFILVGLEVKREMFEGSLSSVQKSIFPALAAIGGMIVPALVYLFINHQHPEFKDGWAIPMATDIAFAVGIVALLSKQVPPALKMFLLALAIIDDLGAIVVIAIFFSHEMSISALTIASLAIIALFVMNRFKVIGLLNYAIVGSILWVSVLKSGVHATLAGVIIGFAIPLKGKNGETPLYHLEHILAPWCTFLILPLFAFSNAGVSLEDMSFSDLTSPLPLGVALGLLLGKPIGVFLFSYVSVLFRIAKLPEGVNFKHIFAISVLCGIGFTMSMFIAGLAFGGENANHALLPISRLGILLGTLGSAVIGYILLKAVTKPTAQAV